MTVEIRTGDFRELARGLDDASVDLVLTDPVYQNVQDYADIARIAARVLVPGGNCVLQCAHEHLPAVLLAVGEHLLYIWELVEHYHKNARMWDKRIFVSYKPWLWFAKPGAKRRGRWVRDSVNGTYSKAYHQWGDGVGFSVSIIDKLTEPGDLVLDPFLGGGTTAVAALQTGRRFVGFEIDADVADVARRRLAEAQLPLFVPGAVGVQAALW